MEYENKIVLVTGAAQGLGKAMSVEFAKAGAKVVLVDRNNAPQISTVDSLRSRGLTAFAYQCDVTNQASVTALRRAVLSDVGVPDIIVNNAMLSRTGGILNLDVEDVRKQMDVNVLGYLRIVRTFLPEMVERRSGWIVNMGSINGLMPPPIVSENLLPYCISKAADISMSQCMAASLKQHGIGVCVVYPDPTHTEAVETITGTASPEFHEGFKKFVRGFNKSSEEVGKHIVQELRKGKFCTTTLPEFRDDLLETAKRGMEPIYAKF